MKTKNYSEEYEKGFNDGTWFSKCFPPLATEKRRVYKRKKNLNDYEKGEKDALSLDLNDEKFLNSTLEEIFRELHQKGNEIDNNLER